ncbi:hypothetical protein ABIB56_001930 [Glaciihabitans sp. UYNi722]
MKFGHTILGAFDPAVNAIDIQMHWYRPADADPAIDH